MRASIAVLGGVAIGALVLVGAVLALDDGGPTGDSASTPTSVTDGTASTSTSVIVRDGDVLVFLSRDVTDLQRQSIEAWLDGHADVAAYEYWDQAESVAEARRLFRDHAEMLAKIDQDPGMIPASYRVVLTSAGLESAGRIAIDVEAEPGVAEAVVPAR